MHALHSLLSLWSFPCQAALPGSSSLGKAKNPHEFHEVDTHLMGSTAEAVEQEAADVLAMVGMDEAQRVQGAAL